MTNNVTNATQDNQKFEFTYSAKQQKEIEAIRSKYLPKKEDKMETLRRLDKSAENRGTAFALVFGIIGTLLLGIGMCCTMVWNRSVLVFILGILIGILGIVLDASAYPVYKKVTLKQREKIAPQIIALSDELSRT